MQFKVLSDIPQMLVLHLARNIDGKTKNFQKIEFGVDLDLSQFIGKNTKVCLCVMDVI